MKMLKKITFSLWVLSSGAAALAQTTQPATRPADKDLTGAERIEYRKELDYFSRKYDMFLTMCSKRSSGIGYGEFNARKRATDPGLKELMAVKNAMHCYENVTVHCAYGQYFVAASEFKAAEANCLKAYAASLKSEDDAEHLLRYGRAYLLEARFAAMKAMILSFPDHATESLRRADSLATTLLHVMEREHRVTSELKQTMSDAWDCFANVATVSSDLQELRKAWKPDKPPVPKNTTVKAFEAKPRYGFRVGRKWEDD